MEIVVIDYRLCSFTYAFHAHAPFSNVFPHIARLLLSKRINPTKLVFAVDIGASKRRKKYPEYKLQRSTIQEKQTPKEKIRRAEFEKQYKQSIGYLSNLGTVIDINGIEADDIASIIAHRFADTQYRVTLVSSDKDWASFLVADNIRLLHVNKKEFITRKTCESHYELDPRGIYWVQCFAGSVKENVKGLNNFGPKTFIKAYEKYKDFDELKQKIYEEYVETKFRNISVPEGYSYDMLVSINQELFKPVKFEDLDLDEQEEFLTKFSKKTETHYDNFMLESLTSFGFPILFTLEEQKIFKLK